MEKALAEQPKRVVREWEDREPSEASSDLDGAREEKDENPDEDEGRMTGAAYRKYRDDLKNQVLAEVIREVFPDMEAFDAKVEMAKREKPNKSYIVNALKFFNLYPLTLHEIILQGSDEQIEEKIVDIVRKKETKLLNQLDQKGRTPLSLAVKIKHLFAITLLLERGADPNLADEVTGRPPIMFSVKNDTQDITITLAKAGALVATNDLKGITPIMIAAIDGNRSHCKLLLRINDMFVDAQDEYGWTALHHAAHVNSPSVCEVLIDHGADRKVRDGNNRKAVHIARFKGHGDVVAVLEDARSKLTVDD